MKYPTIRFLFDRRKKTTSKAPQKDSATTKDSVKRAAPVGYIEIEVSYRRHRRWFGTGIAVAPNQWNDVKMIINHNQASELNLRLLAQKKSIDDYVRTLMLKEQPFTFEGLDAWLERKSNNDSFIDFVKHRIEEQSDLKESTKKDHRKLVSALERFRKIVTFDSLTRTSVLEYDRWLHTQPYTQPTIHSYHKLLKRYINEALARELIQKNPYAGLRIERGKSKDRKYLTEEEVLKIRNTQGLRPSLERIRDVFIFQCYTGLAYADLAKFDFSSVIHRDGKHVLYDQRQKSSEDYYIVLLPQALEVLEKYDYKLPIITNQQYNSRLKQLAVVTGVKRQITSHVARHSFLTMALNHGIPIETVSKMAGHTNIKTTQIYAKLLNKAVESAFDILERELK